MKEAKAKRSESLLTKGIKTFYNISQFLAWLLVLVAVLKNIAANNFNVLQDRSVMDMVRVAQLTQYIDVLFALVGLIPSNPFVSFIQITSRVICLLGAFPDATKSWYPILTLIPWSLAELIRYGTYLNDGLNLGQNWLKHIRYNAFFVLYPAGVTGEFLTCGAAKEVLEGAHKTANIELYGVKLPFSIPDLLGFYRIVVYPALTFMMWHMIKLRAKFYRRQRKEKEK